MKPALIAIVILSGTAFKAGQADDWTRLDTAKQLVITADLIVDWGQTRYISHHAVFHEQINFLMPRHPSIGQVNTYFGTAIIGSYIAERYILPTSWRSPTQYLTIAWEAGLIRHNKSIGIKFEINR